MSSSTVEAPAGRASGSLVRGLWYRQLDSYPDNGPRTLYLGTVVLATIVLYYELYVQGSVAPSIMREFGMSFTYFVYISIIGNAIGAFASLVAGLADRWGRSNLVAYGLGVTGALVFALPHAPSRTTYLVMFSALSFVEGIVLVATPALVRDFSPQLGRASAMGFWTLGPVVGSLVVAEVSSHTLTATSTNWPSQFTYAGIAGIAVFLLAVVALRELSPALRDQLMVSMRDRALIEARAKGLDIEDSLRHPWKQMMHLDVVGSAFAISVFLLVYYAAVGFFVIYFTVVYGFTQQQANSLGNWFWAFDAGALVLIGLLSDRLRVRKPFMLVGALGAAAMTIVFLSRVGHPNTSYSEFVVILSLLAVCLAIAYAPWMASFTETVEKHNPALTATGLAVWGWIIRVVVAVSTIFLPIVVGAVTPLVDHGAEVTVAAATPAGQAVTGMSPRTLAALKQNPTDTGAQAKAVQEIMQTQKVGQGQAVADLQALGTAKGQADIAPLVKYGQTVQRAAADAPHQFRTWWWVCVAGELVFIPFIFTMAGRWSPRKAREDAEAHEALVAAELTELAQQRQPLPGESRPAARPARVEGSA